MHVAVHADHDVLAGQDQPDEHGEAERVDTLSDRLPRVRFAGDPPDEEEEDDPDAR